MIFPLVIGEEKRFLDGIDIHALELSDLKASAMMA